MCNIPKRVDEMFNEEVLYEEAIDYLVYALQDTRPNKSFVVNCFS